MNHYFSHVRLIASPTQNEWLRDLARHGQLYRDHALIWQLFPGDGAQRDFVFRRLEDERSFYVVSARAPQSDSGLFQIQSKPYMPLLEEGELVRFDLRTNPTVSRRDESGRSRRHDVLMDAKRSVSPDSDTGLSSALELAGKTWLLDRATQWGLQIKTESVLQNGYQQQRLTRKGSAIRFSTLDYQGIAQVANAELLKRALLSGIGHSKGFGCGLLLIKRL